MLFASFSHRTACGGRRARLLFSGRCKRTGIQGRASCLQCQASSSKAIRNRDPLKALGCRTTSASLLGLCWTATALSHMRLRNTSSGRVCYLSLAAADACRASFDKAASPPTSCWGSAGLALDYCKPTNLQWLDTGGCSCLCVNFALKAFKAFGAGQTGNGMGLRAGSIWRGASCVMLRLHSR